MLLTESQSKVDGLEATSNYLSLLPDTVTPEINIDPLDRLARVIAPFDLEFFSQTYFDEETGQEISCLLFADTKLHQIVPLGLEPKPTLAGFYCINQGNESLRLDTIERMHHKLHAFFGHSKAELIPYRDTALEIYQLINSLQRQIEQHSREIALRPKTLQATLKYLQSGIQGTPFKLQAETRDMMPLAFNREGVGAYFPVDISLSYRDRTILETSQSAIRLIGWDIEGKGEQHPTKTIELQDVRGIIIVSDDETKKQIHTKCKLGKKWLEANGLGGPTCTVLAVNDSLLKLWRRNGRSFLIEKPIEETVPHEYFPIQTQVDQKPVFSAITYEPGERSHIGGSHLAIQIQYDQTHFSYLLDDWGMNYSRWPWSTMMNFPSHQDLDELLRRQLFRPMREVYRLDLLSLSLKPEIIEKGYQQIIAGDFSFSAIEGFILMELYARIGQEQLVTLMRQKCPDFTQRLDKRSLLSDLFKSLQKGVEWKYQNQLTYLGQVISHPDSDHSRGRSLTRTDIPTLASAETFSSLEIDKALSSNWMTTQTVVHNLYLEPKVGNSFQTVPIPRIEMTAGDRLELAPGFFVTAIAGHHIPGTLCFFYELYHHNRLLVSFFHETDTKDSTGMRGAEAHMKQFAIPFLSLLVMEGTSVDKSNSARYQRTETDVKTEFAQTFQKATRNNETAVVDVIKHNLLRACNIIDEAIQSGQEVVVSPKILFMILKKYRDLQLAEVDIVEPQDYEYRLLLKKIYAYLQETKPRRIFPWFNPNQQKAAYEEYLFRLYGSVNQDIFSAPTPQKASRILIRDYSEPHIHLSGIAAEHLLWIPSSYARMVLDEEDSEIKQKMVFADDHQIVFDRSWKFHATGHGPLYPADHPLAADGRLAIANRLDGVEEIFIDHTTQRGVISSQLLPTYDHLKNATIHKGKHPVKVIVPASQFRE